MTSATDTTKCDNHAKQVLLADGKTWACEGCGAWLDETGNVVASGDDVVSAALALR